MKGQRKKQLLIRNFAESKRREIVLTHPAGGLCSAALFSQGRDSALALSAPRSAVQVGRNRVESQPDLLRPLPRARGRRPPSLESYGGPGKHSAPATKGLLILWLN